MLNRIKNSGTKILVFVINILLLVIAVLVIREKDQSRLLKQAEEDAESSSFETTNIPSSFEGQINQSEAIGQPLPDTSSNNDPANNPLLVTDPPSTPAPATDPLSPSTSAQTQPSVNRATKTS